MRPDPDAHLRDWARSSFAMSRATKSAADATVLVAGGGVAGVETMLALRALAQERVAIDLLAPEPRFWYRPMAVAEPFASGEVVQVDLARLAQSCSAGFTIGELVAVDPERRLAVAASGLELPYDQLVLATGASPEPALQDALTFRGPADVEAFDRVLLALEQEGGRLVLAIPSGACWPLPAYELALQSALRLSGRDAQVALVTPERRPLAVFGEAAAGAVEALLDERGVELHAGRRPVAARAGAVELSSGDRLRYDRLVAVPRLRPRVIEGVPADAEGFVATDEHGRVLGLDRVYAAGDVTSFPVKQGGIAAQQADAVAEAIAAAVGAPVTPHPFRPILRALLLTGSTPLYLRAELGAGEAVSSVDMEPLWWPPTKIVGRYLDDALALRSR